MLSDETHARIIRYIANAGLVGVAMVFVWWLARMIGWM
jgi:hypothetical protein